MAGYAYNREENLEAKQLQRVLKQVDRRVKVPESLDISRLRPLIDDVEPATIRERRLPSWISLQSGIAYAAAFCLIVALVYSTEIYKPNMITGGMSIPSRPQSEAAAASEEIAADELDAAQIAPPELFASRLAEDTADESAGTETAGVQQEAAAEDSDAAVEEFGPGLGGSGLSTLLLERDGYEYRWRPSDAADPDRNGYATLEVIHKDTQELVSLTDIQEMQYVDRAFAQGDALALVGLGENGVAAALYSGAQEPVIREVFEQPGELVDANLYEGILHIVSLTDPADGEDTVVLPDSLPDGGVCVITAIDMETLESAQERYFGKIGSVQLHNLNAYIRYEGVDEDDEAANYIAQIFLDGLEIELGAE